MKLICNLVITDVGKKEIDVSRPFCIFFLINLFGIYLFHLFLCLKLEKLLKITSDAKLDEEDSRACFMVISFILKSAWRFNVDQSIVITELQQLGLPKGFINH